MSEQDPKPSHIISCVDQSIEDYAFCMRKLDVDVMQLSQGSFQARSTLVVLDGLTFIRRRTTSRYLAEGIHPNAVGLFLPLVDKPFYAEGRQIRQDMQIAVVGNQPVHAIIPEGFENLIVQLDHGMLRDLLDITGVERFLSLIKVIRFSTVDLARKRMLTDRLRGEFDRLTGLACAPDEDEQEAVRQRVVGWVYDYLLAHQHPVYEKPNNHEKILQRALVVIRNRPEYAFSLDELAREVFASKRAVQYAFNSIVGLSPMRYLKKCRLNQIRREILSETDSVNFTSIVTRYNFTNPGRMVREYEELFGERPRDTFRRTRLDTAG